MKTLYAKIAAIGAVALMALPGAALAHGLGDGLVNNLDKLNTDVIHASVTAQEHANVNASFKRDKGDKDNDNDGDEHAALKANVRMGKVTALQSNGFSFMAKDGNTYIVLTSGAKLVSPFGKVILLSDIKVNDSVVVRGMLDGSTITATAVLDMPVNTHLARAKGTVTAVTANSFTLQTNNDGVISNVTVNTSADTSVKKADGSVGTTSDITVGSKLRVSGLWDEVLNVLNAVKVKLHI